MITSQAISILLLDLLHFVELLINPRGGNLTKTTFFDIF